MQISKSQQEENEIHAFKEFIVQAQLPIVAESIEKREPPEPDILCALENGKQIAFELVEICHPKNAALMGGAPLLADIIEKAYQDLPSEIKTRFDERFANRPLSFEFRSGVSRNQIASKMDGILTELVDQPSTEDEAWAFQGKPVRFSCRCSTAGEWMSLGDLRSTLVAPSFMRT